MGLVNLFPRMRKLVRTRSTRVTRPSHRAEDLQVPGSSPGRGVRISVRSKGSPYPVGLYVSKRAVYLRIVGLGGAAV